MGMYRTLRPIIVDAVQCNEPKTIATDLGFINAKRGEWIISGEGGECYIVDNAFFQRTFVSLQKNSHIPTVDKLERQVRTERDGGDRGQSPSRACINRVRMRLRSHSVRRPPSETRGK
jgi:hypothetical protein